VPAAEATNTSAPVTVIDVKKEVFQDMMPRLSEIPYLAHCRQVNVANKEAGLSDGWFATIIANRLPTVPKGQQKTAYTAHLVSVFGLERYLGATPDPLPRQFVRLISLANWSFTCDADTGLDFRQLMANLAVPPARTPAGDSSYLLLRLPPTPAASDDATHQKVQSVLQSGYTVVPYRTRAGDNVSAWYRGPLCPAPTTRVPMDPVLFSGQAMVYDSHSGMFDQSYAVAWETGRLLALSDRSFATTLLEWRGQGQRLLNQLHFNIRTAAKQEVSLDSALSAVDDVSRLCEPDLLATKTFLPYVVNAFARSVAGPPDAASAPARLKTAAAPAGNAGAEIGMLMAKASVQKAVALRTQDSVDVIAQWLARLSLLYGVPFANMVPDARMLPAESIRFFYVDQTYIDMMVDGALSVGVHSSRDAQLNTMMHATLRAAVDSAAGALRAKLLRATPVPPPTSNATAGFLLRSAVVSGWPGLEVKAYQAGGQPMAALRIERLAPDVMLALYPSVPSRLELSEPQEGLRFGVEDSANTIELRNVSTTGTPGGEVGFTANARLRGTRNVLDVAATLTAIGTGASSIKDTATKAALQNLGPAGFAVQMVKSPEQMVFYGVGA
jgi:hypothetical protein